MNAIHPHIIARDGDQVVSYALVATKEIIRQHELMGDLFRQADAVIYKGERLSDVSYLIVGQLCVAKPYRGVGLVQSMYERFREELSAIYKYCVTDVDEQNPGSLKAHIKSGFEVVRSIEYGGSKWHIVVREWIR